MSQYILFEKYLENKLSDQDREKFEFNLSNDDTFKSDFDGHVKTQKVFDLILEEELYSEIDSLKKGKPKSSNLRILRPALMAAASIAILVSAYFLLNGPTGNDALLKAFYQEASFDTTRSGDGETKTLPEHKDYFAAQEAFNKQDYKLALTQLKELNNSSNLEVKEFAEWLSILSYLGLDDKARAKELTQKIANNEAHSFVNRAKDLLKKL